MFLDLAIIGAGAAGTRVAREVQRARPGWSIALFERSDRIGGRLRSVRIAGLDHPIELGGMRYLTTHHRVANAVEDVRLSTRAFDPWAGAPDRSLLRGHVGAGAADPGAGRVYELPAELRGRSAEALTASVFDQIVPGYAGLDHDGYVRRRITGRLYDKAVTDWAIGEALEVVLGLEGRRFVTDVFGYDSGMRAFCAPDLVEFLMDGGDPVAEARVPDEGMARIPQAIAAAFEADGGRVHLNRELTSLDVVGGRIVLRFAGTEPILADRVMLTTPVPALRLLQANSRPLRDGVFERILASVEPFPAMKLYLWYDRPWWRPAVAGIRMTTDLAIRKVFYFDGAPGERSALLAMYTDGLHVAPWAELYEGAPAGDPAPPPMLADVHRQLRVAHPEVADVPEPIGSALMFWGADAHEVGWHFWRAGVNSDDILAHAAQPDPAVPIYLASEAFSRRQSWVEGALEAADAAVAALTSASPSVWPLAQLRP